MNVNIILDSDYICNKLNEGKEEKINALFTFMKNMSNIIIIQDNDQNIVRNIIKNEKIKEQEIKQTEIFLSALIQGTNKYDFVTNIKYENPQTNILYWGTYRLKKCCIIFYQIICQ